MRAGRACLAASALNGGTLRVANSAITSVSHLAIVHLFRLSRGIRCVSLRNRVRNGIAVLHECGAEDRVHPEFLIIVSASGEQGLLVKAALFEDRLDLEWGIVELVDTGIQI